MSLLARSSNAVEAADPRGDGRADTVGLIRDDDPLSASAIRATERANCENISIRRACFRSIRVVGS